MTDHPITPPPELVQQWVDATESNDCIGAFPTNFEQRICTAAARWGADQELEACCDYIGGEGKWFANPWHRLTELRTARRPKPPSLKEQALEAWKECWGSGFFVQKDSFADTIRRALEQLDD